MSKHLPIQPRNVCLCLPLSLFPSTFPVTTWYSMPLFLSTCPKKLRCLFAMCFISCLSVWALLNTFSFVTFFDQEIIIILRKNHISAASSCFFIISLIVHVSHPYIQSRSFVPRPRKALGGPIFFLKMYFYISICLAIINWITVIWTWWSIHDNDSEGVVAPSCNPLTLQPEQSGGRGSNPISTFECHDKASRTRLALSYFCDPSTWRWKPQLHLHLQYTFVNVVQFSAKVPCKNTVWLYNEMDNFCEIYFNI